MQGQPESGPGDVTARLGLSLPEVTFLEEMGHDLSPRKGFQVLLLWPVGVVVPTLETTSASL